MEKKHVYEVYEKIAPHFSNTRYKPWPKIEKFLSELEPGSLNLDVGCGNGKYLHVNSQTVVNIGTDRSFNLIGLAMEKNQENQTFVCDSLSLPCRDGTFDSCISIAVIHHFSTISLRVKAVREMARVLRVGGRVLILVWAFEQEHKKFQTQDVFVPWHLQDAYKGASHSEQSNEVEESKFIETGI